MAKNAEVYAKVSAQILDAMEKGVVPWSKSWVGGRGPCNAVSGHRYSGMNVWALAFTAMIKGYSTNGWVTFNQAKKRGLKVPKGGTPIVFMATLLKKPKVKGGEPEKMFIAKLYWVWNLDQLTDLPGHEGAREKLIRKMTRAVSEFTPIESAEALVARSGAKIKRGDDAAYFPITDHIEMPAPTAFKKGADGYYPVLFHELSHWTGAEKRLARDLGGRHGDPRYAMEELVAELSAAFLSHQIGLDHSTRAASYLDRWISALKENPDAFQRASSLAQKSADYLLPADEVAEEDDDAEVEMAVA